MAGTIAVILGGGRGTRLYPLTRERAKPAVPLAGKYRLIDIPISNCINSGLRRISLLTQFNTHSLHRHIRTTYNFDTFTEGYVNILAAEQTMESTGWYQGTADAVRKNLRHLDLGSADHVLILSGDQLYRMDYSELIAQHEREGADATLAVLPVPRDQASGLGILHTSGHRIVDFVEKPQTEAELDRLAMSNGDMHPPTPGRTHLASMGIYLFRTEVLRAVLADETKEDFGREIIPEAIRQSHVDAYFFDGYWEDIGTIRAFYDANLELTRPDARFNFFDEEAPIYTHPRNLPPSRMDHCHVERSIIADGCIIDDAEILGSVIGVRTLIGAGTTIRDSIVMGLDYFESDEVRRRRQADIPIGIGRHCRISGALLDKNCRIGDGVTIDASRYAEDMDSELFVVRDGIVIVPRATTVPDGTII
ncbi:glucose-1-phosphate adenylyltransferase [bacterium]|nr:glucose-1-phosphate adenylyltransferase [bacterium]